MGEGKAVLQTARLILRLFRPGDIEPLHRMNGNPRVMEFLGGVRTRAQDEAQMVRVNRAFPAEGFGMMPVERRSDGAFLGIAGLNRVPWYPDEVEVGWRLLPEHWGQGYATEAGRAWIGHAFATRPDLPRVISVADVPNVRSRAVMARLGMRLDHVARLREGDDAFEAAVHAVTREEWEGGATPTAPAP
jgi:RimJ/RimL family protein N-acetyltransferase